MPFIRSTQKCSTLTLAVNKNMLVRFHQNKCCESLSLSKVLLRKEALAIKQKKKEKERKNKRKKREKEKERKKKMGIKIDHVLTKIFQVPIKREMSFNEHSRITLVTKYST